MISQDDFKTEFNGPLKALHSGTRTESREVRRWRPCSASLTMKRARPGEWP